MKEEIAKVAEYLKNFNGGQINVSDLLDSQLIDVSNIKIITSNGVVIEISGIEWEVSAIGNKQVWRDCPNCNTPVQIF